MGGHGEGGCLAQNGEHGRTREDQTIHFFLHLLTLSSADVLFSCVKDPERQQL